MRCSCDCSHPSCIFSFIIRRSLVEQLALNASASLQQSVVDKRLAYVYLYHVRRLKVKSGMKKGRQWTMFLQCWGFPKSFRTSLCREIRPLVNGVISDTD